MASKTKKVANSIDSQDLGRLQELYSAVMKITGEMGEAVVEQNQRLNDYNKVSTQYQQFSAGLEFKYGKVSINIQDGTYKTETEALKEVEDGADPKN